VAPDTALSGTGTSDVDLGKRMPITCTLDCGARCELVAVVHDGRLVRIDSPRGQPDTPERPRLVPCARGRAHRRLLSAHDRVLYPLRRTGPRGSGEFERISWEHALDEVAGHLVETRARYGSEAIFHATGAGSVSGRGFSGAPASRRFFSYWAPVTQSVGNQSYHCAEIAARWMLGGTVPASDRATLLDSKLIILWGMNPAETRMGPNTAHFVAEARDLGARVVLIDPRYTDTGVLASEWIPIRPGTDAALVAAMAYVTETEGLVDPFISTHTVGYQKYRDYLLGREDSLAKTPAWAESITGVAVATTQALARDYATVKPAALLAGWGPQRGANGEQAARAFITLACMSGNVGIKGGGLASVGTRYDASLVGDLPAGPHGIARAVSAGGWAGAILDGVLDPPLKMAYIVASNLANRSPNVARNLRALGQLEFIAVNEQFLTPTARHADVVLPICTDLERSDVVTAWANDCMVFYSPQVVEAEGESRSDFWVFSELARRMGFGHTFTQGRTQEAWIERLLEQSRLDVDALVRDGIVRTDGAPRVGLAGYREDAVAHSLATPSGLIEISSSQAGAYGLPDIPSYVPDRAGERWRANLSEPLQIVTPHSKLRSNSCLHANPWLQRAEPHDLWISRDDAAVRSICDGDLVEVSNQFGRVQVSAKVTGRIMPGVVCLYQGTWYRRGDDGRDVGASANSLTSQRQSPTGGPTTHSSWVEVRGIE
jgi:anaerobic dimethyl sulfoxide reductase subunit A